MKFTYSERQYFPLQQIWMVLFTLGCLWGVCQRAAWAQSPFLNHTVFGIPEGLPCKNTNAVLEDADGYIWIGTHDGLCRFDGAKITTFRAGPKPGQLRGQHIKCLLKWDSLHILVGSDAGIARLNIRTFRADPVVFQGPPELTSKINLVQQLLRSRNGGLYAVTTAGVHRLSGSLHVQQSWLFPADMLEKAPGIEPSRIWEMPNGTVWVTGPSIFKAHQVELHTIFEIDPAQNTMRPLPNPPFGDQKRFLALRQLNDTLGFVCYENLDKQPVTGLFNLRTRQFKSVPCRSFRFWDYLPFLSEPEPGKIGMSTYTALADNTPSAPLDYYLLDWKQEKWTYWEVRPGRLLQDMVKTRAGYYFGASNIGLVRGTSVNVFFDQKPWLCPDNAPNDRQRGWYISTVAHIGNQLHIATHSNGLYSYDETTGICSHLQPQSPVWRDVLYDIVPVNRDTVLVSGEGVYWLDLGSGKTWPMTGIGKPALLDTFSAEIFKDSRGLLWMANFFLKGILRYDPATGIFHRYAFQNTPGMVGLAEVDGFVEDHNGNIWMGGTMGGGLVCWERATDRFRVYHPDLNSNQSFRDNIVRMTCDQQGRIWFGTEGYGVYYFHPKDMVFRNFSMAQGLPNAYIRTLTFDQTGKLWIGTVAGLCRYDPVTGQAWQFFKEHGLPSSGIIHVSMLPGNPARLFIATDQGFRLTYPDQFPTVPIEKRVIVHALRVNGKSTDFSAGQIIELDPDEDNIEIEFSHLNLLDGHLDRFEYRFANWPEGRWTAVGKENVLRLAGLGPGLHEVFLRVCTNGGACFEQPLVRMRVRRPFVQSPFFYALIGLLLAAPVFVYLRSRLRLRLVVLEQEHDRDLLRNRIAQDIHDEVGNRLTRISLSAQVAARLPDLDADDLQKRLAQLGADARTAAAGLREIVFAINPDYDRFSEMQAYFRETAREFWNGTDTNVHFDFLQNPACDPLVPPDTKRQLLLIFKEALNNVAKHSGATVVVLAFFIDDTGHFLLEIRDNGRGFEPNQTNGASHGLSGMKKRAESIAATLAVVSSAGAGTTVRVEGDVFHTK
jgi:signal transduction histidine kinase/ligand-binding sensor domain-containing protein